MTALTQAEVKKAIYEAEQYVAKLCQDFKVNNKTYSILKFSPGLGLTLKLSKPYSIFFKDLLTTGDIKPYEYIECWNPGLLLQSHRVELVEDTGETCVQNYDFLFWTWLLLPIGHLPVSMELASFQTDLRPDPNNPKRMKLTVTKVKWHRDDVTGDLYIEDRLLMEDVKSQPDGTEAAITTGEFKCFRPVGYWLYYEQPLLVYYYWLHNLQRDRANKLSEILKDYDIPFITSLSISCLGPYCKQISYNDVFCNPANFGPCGEKNLPRGIGFSPWFDSDYCICRGHLTGHITFQPTCGVCVYLAARGEEWCHAGTCYSRYSWLDNAAIKATFLMCKHLDPTYKDEVGYSAEDYLLNGWVDGCGKEAPPLISYWEKGKGFWSPIFETYHLLHGHSLTAFTILGYGFGNATAQEVADDLAAIAVKTQWGYPWTSEYVGDVGCKGYWLSPEGSLKLINRPDHRGGMISHFGWIGDMVYNKPLKLGEKEKEKEEFMWVVTPETLETGPTSVEATIPTMYALRLYEAYKWRTP